jgi:hypothetical protein
MRTLATTHAPLLAIAAILPALALSGTAHAQATEERLSSPEIPGFTIGFAATNDTQSIREEVPEGETTQRWSRLITTQRFTGLASRVTPKKYAARVIRAMKKRCSDVEIDDTRAFEMAGRKAYQFKVECPIGATGRREAFIMLAVAGVNDMHVKQVAFRGQVVDSGLAWGRRYLDAVTFCLEGSQYCAR